VEHTPHLTGNILKWAAAHPAKRTSSITGIATERSPLPDIHGCPMPRHAINQGQPHHTRGGGSGGSHGVPCRRHGRTWLIRGPTSQVAWSMHGPQRLNVDYIHNSQTHSPNGTRPSRSFNSNATVEHVSIGPPTSGRHAYAPIQKDSRGHTVTNLVDS
jgi:hypothetical protein